jgi:hypothetical protein
MYRIWIQRESDLESLCGYLVVFINGDCGLQELDEVECLGTVTSNCTGS